MGCAVSSFHSARRFRRIDPADFDEEYLFSEDEFGPARSFGQYRVGGGNLPPDDRQGIPSPFVIQHLASDPGPILYQAEMDHGLAYRALRPLGCWSVLLTILNPYRLCSGLLCSVDETCCWLRKEYSTRNFYYVYSNRIVTNRPQFAFPWAFCTIERWSRDHIITHGFDRGSYGFSRVNSGTIHYCCCCWPLFGGVVARHCKAT